MRREEELPDSSHSPRLLHSSMLVVVSAPEAALLDPS